MSIGPVQWSTRCVIALPALLMLAGCSDELDEESTEENALSSVCDARTDIDDQSQQLADSYRDTFAPIDCS